MGGGWAWFVQFAVNLALTFAQCNQPTDRFRIPIHTLEIAISAVAIAVALAAEGVALWMFRRTAWLDHVSEQERRGKGVKPPVGRLQFLAMIGMTVNFLALVIMVMTGIGAPLLPVCQQS
jgi:amino acid transporter